MTLADRRRQSSRDGSAGARTPPVLCGLHSRELREAYLSWLLGPADETEARWEAVLQGTEGCHYCQPLRGIGKFGCCALLHDPKPGHEHRWASILETSETSFVIALRVDQHSGISRCCGSYRCELCGAVIDYFSVFEPDALLHTCRQCGNLYRDGDPLSTFCSWDCVTDAKTKRRRERLEQMVEYATMKGQPSELIDRFRENLEALSVGTAYDETLRTLAMEARKRLAQGAG